MSAAARGFLLDTNAVSDLIREPQGAVAGQVAATAPAQLCTSIVVACELRFGVLRKGSPRLTERVHALLAAMNVLPFDAPADRHYAELRAALEAAGTPIGSHDLFIAAHARSRDLVLVTRNTREFDRVPGLVVEDWAAPKRRRTK